MVTALAQPCSGDRQAKPERRSISTEVVLHHGYQLVAIAVAPLPRIPAEQCVQFALCLVGVHLRPPAMSPRREVPTSAMRCMSRIASARAAAPAPVIL